MHRENLEKLWGRVEQACRRSGRKREEIRLVVVTKKVSIKQITSVLNLGVCEIGESRVQEAQSKYPEIHSFNPSLKWHMIGHLQGNKVNRAVEIFDCIQSVDSTKLLERIDRKASEIGKIQDCLVEFLTLIRNPVT